MEPRDYQTAAVQAAYKFLQDKPVVEHPLIVLPTAAGKTPVMATICRDSVTAWNGRVLVLAHVKELLEQTARTLKALCPTLPIGIYSAGLKRRDTTHDVIVAGIQSVYDKADQLGSFDLVLVDECHLIPESGEGRYLTLIAALQEINPDIRIIGLTATPYRLDSGAICGPDKLFSAICYEVGVKELMRRGFLCKLISKQAANAVDTSALKVVRGEFDTEQEAKLFNDVTVAAANEILEKTIGSQRRSVLIFCSTIAHAREVAGVLRKSAGAIRTDGRKQLEPARELFGEIQDDHTASIAADYLDEQGLPTESLRYSLADSMGVAEVYGDTPSDDRATIIEDFKAGKIKYLVNVGVFTTGFDAPNVDCVVLLRATASAGLYYQMVGRAFRIHPEKSDALILDFGENVLRHGPVDCIKVKTKKDSDGERPAKVCPNCQTIVATGIMVCPECGHMWERAEPKSKLRGKAGDDEIVSGETVLKTSEVMAVTYKVHHKKGAAPGAPRTLRVTYQLSMSEFVSEWVCVEHPPGYARDKARTWWQARCAVPMPSSAAEAVAIADYGLIAEACSITVRTKPGETFPNIVDHDLDRVPTASNPCPKCGAKDYRYLWKSDNPKLPYAVKCGSCDYLHGYAGEDFAEAFGVFDPEAGQVDTGSIRFTVNRDLIPQRAVLDSATEWKAMPKQLEPAEESEIPF